MLMLSGIIKLASEGKNLYVCTDISDGVWEIKHSRLFQYLGYYWKLSATQYLKSSVIFHALGIQTERKCGRNMEGFFKTKTKKNSGSWYGKDLMAVVCVLVVLSPQVLQGFLPLRYFMKLPNLIDQRWHSRTKGNNVHKKGMILLYAISSSLKNQHLFPAKDIHCFTYNKMVRKQILLTDDVKTQRWENPAFKRTKTVMEKGWFGKGKCFIHCCTDLVRCGVGDTAVEMYVA